MMKKLFEMFKKAVYELVVDGPITIVITQNGKNVFVGKYTQDGDNVKAEETF